MQPPIQRAHLNELDSKLQPFAEFCRGLYSGTMYRILMECPPLLHLPSLPVLPLLCPHSSREMAGLLNLWH